MHTFTFKIKTNGRGFISLTKNLNDSISRGAFENGLCHVFIHHTSASLLITENADPKVLDDLERFMQRMIPDKIELYTHTEEGADDMPSHIRSALTQTFLLIPIKDKKLDLGTWQGVFLWEHRYAAHERKITISLL